MHKIFFFLFSIISFASLTAQNDKISGNLLTPEQMQEDVQFFYKKLIETHPNPYQQVFPEYLKNRVDEIITDLTVPLSIDEFYSQISVLNRYFDDHTGISNMNIFAQDHKCPNKKEKFQNVYLCG